MKSPTFALRSILCTSLLCLLLLGACRPRPELNVLGYQLAAGLGTLQSDAVAPGGSLHGRVLFEGAPAAHVSIVVAERTGAAHSTRTDEQGAYRLTGIPPGQYVIGAAGPGYQETALRDALGIPLLTRVMAGVDSQAHPLVLQPAQSRPLPANPAAAFALQLQETVTATAAFPAGSTATVFKFQYTRAGEVNDSLRLYLPIGADDLRDRPLLLASYPGGVDGWESVSVALAAQGFPLVAHAPLPSWGVNVDEHAYDARLALALARSGQLSRRLDNNRVIALGGSFSSAILNRLLRESSDEIAGWVTLGGISDAFSGAHDFYNGRIEIPAQYAMLIPALGPPHIYPETFLRYSPVYSAGALPPTLIIHTAADTIIPISQAYDLEIALKRNGIPVEVFYYEDSSHYLQIEENMTDAGREMFYRIVAFVERYGKQ